ncbi:protein giant [Fopius arisanus]|uniref:Protein giant n=1 Tax=Fopius arisanus TaxID=64838 RepID=A0A9R1U4L7_9HYME|nr:PREDICTED: protein giant [Fopius arisanus]XP_011306911.1 PREDICTED: protein giant [Fopius arisanus]XP_011306912.1 PREDICTED: protein giant [Fopius arisanus]
MTMESCNESQIGEHALDFTKSSKEETEPPILDLSCKKEQSSQRTAYNLSPAFSESLSFSPPSESTSSEPSQHQLDFKEERKSPFEGRTFMVTPPSESDSPKKSKYEPIYPQMSAVPTDITHRYPLLPKALPMPLAICPTVPSLPINQNGGITNQIQIPVSTAYPSVMNQEVSSPLVSPETSKKAPRPFKAYPKDPLALTMGPEIIYDQNSNEAYSEFRKRMLDSVRRTNEGTNIKMRRVSKSPGLPTSTMGALDDKDAAYWERRRKNNEAAKRSRDARRAKEDEIAIRAAFLEQENMKLKYELVALRNETAKLRCMVYSN